MTTYGLDVSHYQGAIDLARLNLRSKQGYAFVMAKATEGDYYSDSSYHAFREQAQAEGMYFAAYHFLTHGNIAAQVARFCGFVTDPSIPVMLDIEAYGATMADAEAFRAAMRAKGRRVTLAYVPHWYWERIGRPSLKGWTIVSSAYPSTAHKIGSALYPGKGGTGWVAYGGVKPTFWQFASSGKIDGYAGNVDLDAFEGNPDTLANWFKNYGHAPAPKPTPAPKPKVPTRVENFHTKYQQTGIADLRILDRAAVTRTGDVRDIRNRLAFQVRQLPHDKGSSRVNKVTDTFAKSRTIDLNLLDAAVKAGRVGRVKQVRDRIKALIGQLPPW